MTDPERSDLERALRQALRPVEPRAGFEARLMHALDASPPPQYRRPWWSFAYAAAAAFALAAVGGLSYREHVETLRAEQTRAQVLEALRIANDKLGTAFRLISDEPGADGSLPERGGPAGPDRQFN